MVDRLRVHRPDDADIIRDPGSVRQQIADPCLRLSVLLEINKRTDQWERCLVGRHTRQPLGTTDGGWHLLPLHLPKLRFEIK